MLRSSSIRISFNLLKQINRSFSSAATPALPFEKHGVLEENAAGSPTSDEIPVSNFQHSIVEQPKSPIVAAAFASLKEPSFSTNKIKILSLDDQILKCKSPEELLALAQKSLLSRKQALKIVTTLAEWSVNGLANMSTFETDPRFVSLCQLLGKSPATQVGKASSNFRQNYQDGQGDLSVVLGVKGEEEAANLASGLTLPQMVKVFTKLASQKKRSLPLLRSVAFSVADSQLKLDIKKAADILFALATLNFPEEVVLEKVCNDLSESIPFTENSSVIGSISVSLGRLRYRNDRVLDCLGEWVVNNQKFCRNQELVSLLITLAILNHVPATGNKLFDLFTSRLSLDDLPSATTWLDVVWSLVVLGKATSDHYRSVLSQIFLRRIVSSNLESSSVTWKRKILNINGAATLCKDYKGPTLEGNKDISIVPMLRSKDKQQLVSCVLDSLSNLLPSALYLRNNVDFGMGFLIDGECRLDGNMTPIPLIDKKTGEAINSGKGHKVAVMCWDYHDITRGKADLSGGNALSADLLQKAGYRVLSIKYNDFNVQDKVSKRMHYIESNLKHTICRNS